MDEMKIYNTLKEIYFYLDDGDRRFLGQYNLSVPRFFSLKHIREHPGISPTELSVRMLTDKSNITRMIRGLEADDLVIRKPNATDGRAICLYLTTSGQALLDEVSARHTSFNRDRFSDFSQDQMDLLAGLGAVSDLLADQLKLREC